MAEEKNVTTATHSGNSVGIEHNYNKEFRNREEHVDPNKPIKILEYEDPRDVYTELFGDALSDYNERMEKTRHPERKIDNYYNKMYADYIANKDNPKKKAVPPIREEIVGIYEEKDDETDEKKFELSEEEQVEMLTEFFEQWKKNNPNMRVVGCAIHLDEPEAGIHMQIDYIPVGHCSRGLATQVNMKQALREEGYTDREHVNNKGETVPKRADALAQWDRANNDLLQDICEQHGLHVNHPQRDAKEAGEDAPEHEDTPQYKATTKKAKKDANKIRQQAREDANQIREEARKQAEADAKQTREKAEEDARTIRSKAREEILEEKQETRDERAHLIQKEQEAEQKEREAERAKQIHEQKAEKARKAQSELDKEIADCKAENAVYSSAYQAKLTECVSELDALPDNMKQKALDELEKIKQKAQEAEEEASAQIEKQKTRQKTRGLPYVDYPGRQKQKQKEDEPSL